MKSFDIELPRFDSPAPSKPAAAQRPVSYSLGASPQKSQDQPSAPPIPLLPRTKRPALGSHRHDANPALALNLLQDIQTAVEGWHGKLRQVLRAIQDLYLEGPIVEGWLEAVQPGQSGPTPAAAVLRHGDPQQLQTYVDKLCEAPVTPALGASHYRLCSLDADGRLQCQPCPPDQLSYITLAVARHQKLQQLLSQKSYLEARLSRAVEALTQTRTVLDLNPKP